MRLGKLFFCLLFFCAHMSAASYTYFRAGNPEDRTTKTDFGIALLGGGTDIDEAFRFLCKKAGGGDFLVLRARGEDAYNAYVQGLCKLNSMATLIIPSREAAEEPAVAEKIRAAEAVFIAGGDQANYLNFWQGTPVQDALNRHIAAGKPIGGTSAGLAVLGEFVYSAQGDAQDDEGLKSSQTLQDPFHPRVTVRRNFVQIELLRNILTDTHLVPRDRIGRTLTFLARIVQDGWSKEPRAIAMDEKSGVLVDSNGDGRIVGRGKGAYFLSVTAAPAVCRPKTPLTFRGVHVYRAPAGTHFNVQSWQGSGGRAYSLSVVDGKIESDQPGGSIY